MLPICAWILRCPVCSSALPLPHSRQVLVELAPSYFQYIDSTAGKPTALAKLLGFYTVEIRNLETGTVQSKADLLVMENLFYEQTIAKTFDLKGIASRKAKANSDARENGAQKPKTLFDGDWIEGAPAVMSSNSSKVIY